MKSIPLAAAAAIMIGIAGPVAASETAGRFFIKDVRLFDGTKFQPVVSVLVEDGRVKAVGAGLAAPEGAVIVDGSGKTLLPGLIDAHVHVWSADALKQYLYFGVTSVVDMFTSAEFMAGVHKAQAGDKPPLQAYLVSPGILATAAGGHGTQFGVAVPTLSGPGDAAKFVDDRIAEGSDFIKLIYDDGAAYKLAGPTLSRETLRAVIKAAHARGKAAVVHAGTLKRCLEAVEAGADGIAHLNFDDAYDPAFAGLAKAKKAFVIPTFCVLSSMNGHPDPTRLAEDPRLTPYFRPEDLTGLRQATSFTSGPGAYAAAERELRDLVKAGVPILAGTDALNPGTAYGPSLHGELELLVKAGMTPIEALRSATSVPAKVFGMTGRGMIAPDARADLVLVEGDPASDIKASRAIAGVWKGGVRVDREGYLGEVRKAREAIEKKKDSPPPENFGAGLISDFEGDAVKSDFGAGWMISTDSMMGGKSKADMSLVEGGANGSGKSLLIKGTVVAAGNFRWAGAFFSPGPRPMSPANLSSKPTLKFSAKASGQSFAVLVYAQSLGFIPKAQVFQPGPDWKEFAIPFSKMGIGGEDIMGIFIGASGTPGDFNLQIDDVRLE